MFVEGATLLCQKTNMMRQMKEKGEFDENTLAAMRKKQDQEMEEACQDIYQEFKVTEFFVREWIVKFQDDPEIKGYFDKLSALENQVFSSSE
jgi:hypothetical protein